MESMLGDIIVISSNNRFGLAKVIFVSNYFKDVILIRLFREVFVDLKIDEIKNLQGEADLYYTSIDPVRKGRWKKIGAQPVSSIEKYMSKRIVGGDVWIEDDCIGPASQTELKLLPQMRTFGYRLIEKAVARLP